jgi:DNA-damage-inducible protein J
MTQVSIRIDEDLKTQAEAFFKNVGLTMSSAMSLFLRQCVNQHRIPFEIVDAVDPIYNPVDLPRIKQSIEQGRRGEVVVKTLDELEAMANG